MALKKTVAIILRTMKLGETSVLLTLYSRDVAVLKLVAKGARSSKSRFSGILQPLNTVEVIYYEKPNRDLYVLNQAAILSAPDNRAMSPDSTVLAMACCEMAARLEAYSAVSAAVFEHLSAVLKVMETAEAHAARASFLAFQAHLLQTLGYSPDLEHCSGCGATTAPAWSFDFQHVRLFCPDCSNRIYQLEAFRPETLQTLQRIFGQDLRNTTGMPVNSGTLVEVYRFLDRFYQYHLPEMQNLKSLKVLRQMKVFSQTKKRP